LCLSFVVIVGFVGQISVLQLGLAGVAGVIISKLALHTGIGFPFGLIIAMAGAVVLGTVSAIPALRIRGVTLAIVTLAAAWVLQEFVFANPVIGGGVTAAVVPSPHLFGIDLGPNAAFPINASSPPSPAFGGICVIAAVLVGMFVAALRRGGAGARMLAVRSNERAAAAVGIDVRREKLIAFAIASAIAGFAGGLYAYDAGSVSASNFGVLPALGFLAFAYMGGITTVSGAFIGGLLVTQGIGILAVNRAFGVPLSYQLLVGGIALILTIMFNPVGIAGAVSEAIRRAKERRAQPTSGGTGATIVPAGAPDTRTAVRS
jgi:branched-chain amino acid transport system permease protein